MNPVPLARSLAVASIVSLAACGGGSSTGGALGVSPLATLGQSNVRAPKGGLHPAACTPSVWASSLSSNAVYGFTAPSSTPCVTLNGTYNGLPFNAPISLAIGANPRRLYVADLNNNRIVVFNYQGSFIKAMSTTLGTTVFQPWGVCVSPRGIVGVGNRQYNNSGPAGNVEFFLPTTPNNGTPSGYASGVLLSDEFCAFDKKSNFFVDGVALSGGQKIAYVPRFKVNLPGQTLVDSNLGNASFWVGMYSRINNPANDTLSVGTSVGNSSTETVMNWTVSGPGNGPLSFSPLASYVLTSYPVTIDAVYQLAPGRQPADGTAELLYIADYGNSTVLDSPANGGAVVTYNPVGSTVGVATRPTGQY